MTEDSKAELAWKAFCKEKTPAELALLYAARDFYTDGFLDGYRARLDEEPKPEPQAEPKPEVRVSWFGSGSGDWRAAHDKWWKVAPRNVVIRCDAVFEAGYKACLEAVAAETKPPPGVVEGVCGRCKGNVTVSYRAEDIEDRAQDCMCPFCKRSMDIYPRDQPVYQRVTGVQLSGPGVEPKPPPDDPDKIVGFELVAIAESGIGECRWPVFELKCEMCDMSIWTNRMYAVYGESGIRQHQQFRCPLCGGEVRPE